ncbi:hypothetical protein EVAR_75608_1 [Eumeta japonica]|uniref:Uncharacterized protein n=1 Tax=Eumeta variegata TaxID=151549 RepID=A0A4C1U1C7_EUMVA|nr:hypothetical protein EVAR_75608_1 [Eumeta japonica]
MFNRNSSAISVHNRDRKRDRDQDQEHSRAIYEKLHIQTTRIGRKADTSSEGPRLPATSPAGARKQRPLFKPSVNIERDQK